MPYWRLFYHLTWSTKHRAPLLTADVEPTIYRFLTSKACALGATVFALNGLADHVHMVVSIPPRIAVAAFVGQVKAAASTRYNKSRAGDTPFFWQAEYGAISLSEGRLYRVIAYVENQKLHHKQRTIMAALEGGRDQGGDLVGGMNRRSDWG